MHGTLKTTRFIAALFVLATVACHSTDDGGRSSDRDAEDAVSVDRSVALDPDVSTNQDAARDPVPDLVPDAALDSTVDRAESDPDVPPEPDTIDDTAPIDVGELSVCDRWNTDRAFRSEGSWSGSVAGCDPGTVSDEGLDNALRQVNLYRWLADLPPVEYAAEFNARAQACALLMDANDAITHSPPSSWTCYNETAAQAAGASSISMAPGVQSVDHYMVDRGNPTTLGHRRWILSDWLNSLGLGSTNQASCMYFDSVFGGAGGWTAWPPPGEFPLQAGADPWATIDDTGWSIQSDNISFTSAEVTIEADGADLPVTVASLLQNYGSGSAISIIPDGWQMRADTTYSVSVTGLSVDIEYDVSVVDCSR